MFKSFIKGSRIRTIIVTTTYQQIRLPAPLKPKSNLQAWTMK